MVGAQELVLVVGDRKPSVELLAQWHNMMSLRDGLEFAANEAGFASPRLEGHSG
ncbi:MULTISPECIES: hypothetical protein [Bradyrhizobium]|nr:MULTISPECIES: hypothetical protein [Bradyrhizobium]